jgi:peptidoglycan/xylan/chitin deacetylase (PgdA/CDA1 family)
VSSERRWNNRWPVLGAIMLLLIGGLAAWWGSTAGQSVAAQQATVAGSSGGPDVSVVTSVEAATASKLTAAERAVRVAVLGYHQFEDGSKDPWVLPPAVFRTQMQALKDANITVISMDDFLAWRKGEKAIPERSAVITIDDGYVSAYNTAWPILKEFGYPFTMYVYTNYISKGGKSIKWDQLKEMSAAGVDIACHSRSHDVMTAPRHRPKAETNEQWLDAELIGSKAEIEAKIGKPVRTFAFPYGKRNDAMSEIGLKAGYEVMFSIKDEPALIDSPAGKVGRYMIHSDNPASFDRLLTAYDPTGKAHPTWPSTSAEPDTAPDTSLETSTETAEESLPLPAEASIVTTLPSAVTTLPSAVTTLPSASPSLVTDSPVTTG